MVKLDSANVDKYEEFEVEECVPLRAYQRLCVFLQNVDFDFISILARVFPTISP